MAGVNTQVEVRRGKNPKEPLVPVVKGRTFKKVQAGSSRQIGNQGSSKQIKQNKNKNRHSTICGVVAVHSLGSFFHEERKKYCSYSKQSLVIYVNQKCSQDDVLEEGSV